MVWDSKQFLYFFYVFKIVIKVKDEKYQNETGLNIFQKN